mmetsp:Transcript_33404/g.92273  ORF Transcript_33404/g.92273 Transcript_33404/m.92273 type:complete len:267 (-) Transcript_33404:243-1043(-)|eukprot:CAMPEP_0117498872 /NCGR_PEP_ID=MMETSP0784-20121206/21944_1 /TAXON_ID=39447 /ORGANISM="" /LENGTH=266 /DNA_ID=CAMNT_0005293983 /DNA_START=10 /DNA_END=810 /DNA_ORIENTATION=+
MEALKHTKFSAVPSLDSGAWQTSEPIKVQITKCSSRSMLQRPLFQAKAPKASDQGYSSTDEPDTASSCGSHSNSEKTPQRARAGPTASSDPTMPKRVERKTGGKPAEKTAGQLVDTKTMVSLWRVPMKYSEEMLLQDFKDAGFQKKRDFDFFFMPANYFTGEKLGVCYINFVDMTVMRAFLAAFQDRTLQHSDRWDATVEATPTTYANIASTLCSIVMSEDMAFNVQEPGTIHPSQRKNFCPQCGVKRAKEFKFCIGCGVKLGQFD